MGRRFPPDHGVAAERAAARRSGAPGAVGPRRARRALPRARGARVRRRRGQLLQRVRAATPYTPACTRLAAAVARARCRRVGRDLRTRAVPRGGIHAPRPASPRGAAIRGRVRVRTRLPDRGRGRSGVGGLAADRLGGRAPGSGAHATPCGPSTRDGERPARGRVVRRRRCARPRAALAARGERVAAPRACRRRAHVDPPESGAQAARTRPRDGPSGTLHGHE